MTTFTATPATAERFRLGEGPVWDPTGRRLLWVDIPAGEVVEGVLLDDRIRVADRHRFDGTVGAVALAADGGLLVAVQERLVARRPDGTRIDGPRIIPCGERRRLNDGAVDPAGRYLVGSLSLGEPSEREVLVRLEPDGSLTGIDDDLTLSNGLAWSVDGRRLYSVDSLRHAVYVRDYDAATGAVGERRVHLRIDDGVPDGAVMDAADHLWVAVWGAGEIRRFAPDGTLVDGVVVAAPHTSCAAFAGDDLDLLVITTAATELSDEQSRTFPDSGRVFTARVDVPGHPVPAWSGATFP